MNTATYLDWLPTLTDDELRAELLNKSRVYYWQRRHKDRRATDAAWERMSIAEQECEARGIDPQPILDAGRATHTAGTGG